MLHCQRPDLYFTTSITIIGDDFQDPFGIIISLPPPPSINLQQLGRCHKVLNFKRGRVNSISWRTLPQIPPFRQFVEWCDIDCEVGHFLQLTSTILCLVNFSEQCVIGNQMSWLNCGLLSLCKTIREGPPIFFFVVVSHPLFGEWCKIG
jgi:hypothetical protein